jgi:hypothetical protein
LEQSYYEKEVNWQAKKKRQKKNKKLWRNTIPLICYRGILETNFEHLMQRRKECNKEEVMLFGNFWHYYKRKDIEPIIKNFNKKCYSEPRECRSKSEDCECQAQTIDPQSNVVMI